MNLIPENEAAPVQADQRIVTLDLLRGFAVLGILLVNMWAYALPFPASLNPHMLGFDTVSDRLVHLLVFMISYTKTMPIFAILFGAGILLFTQRQEDRGNKPAKLFLRRQFWLLVIGLAHAYLIWNGDILVPYATTGVIVFFLRKRSTRTLLILAIVALIIPKLGAQAGSLFMEKMQVEAEAGLVAEAEGRDLTTGQMRARDQWVDIDKEWNPTPEDLEETQSIMRGGYWNMVTHYAPETMIMHLFMYPMFINWNLGSFMLLGMVLFRTGVLTGEKSALFYRKMAFSCYALGLPLSLLALWVFNTQFNLIAMIRWGFPLMNISGPLVALGHIALLCLAWKLGWLGSFQYRLMAVGRMAFTNYLTQTLICGALFFGFGFGLFGALHRPALLAVTVAIWALQLWWSPWWLARFRFGPLEWLWRSLTYGRWQPFYIYPDKT